MLKSNKVNLILALIIAIVLWAYVLVDVSQSSTETIKNVPITIMNESALEDDDLVVLSTDCDEVNISYSCQRSVFSKISKSDFTVTADVEGLKKGSHKVKLYVTAPDDVTIENVSTQKITVTVDDLVTAKKAVTPVIENNSSDEEEPDILQISDESVTVKGPATLVDKVNTLNAVLDASKVGTEMKSFTIPLVPVDADGNRVSRVTPSKDNVSITAVLLQKKTVDLVVPITGEDSDEFERTTTVPKTITIKGRDDLLSEISSITCQTVDLSDIYKDCKIKLTPILPSNIDVATESESLCIEVAVKGVESKTFAFSETDVQVNDVTENMSATVGDVAIKVTVTAKSDIIAEIGESDFTLEASVDGLEAGEHKVKLTCTCKKSHTNLDCSPSTVNVTIAEADSE